MVICRNTLFYTVQILVVICVGFFCTVILSDVSMASSQPVVSQERIDKLMDGALDAMVKRDYRRAIRFFTKLLEYPEHENSQKSLEYLAVARERNGQHAHARKLYERYLGLYPEGEDAKRIKQRLEALLSATDITKKKLKKRKRDPKKSTWNIYGSFSQYYRRDVSTTSSETRVNQSSLNSGISMTGRLRNKRYNLRSRLTANYEHDFLDAEGHKPLRISTLYFDAQEHKYGLSGRIGRQSSSRGGVLGRFDGLNLGYQMSDRTKLNMVFGFPVTTRSMDTVNSDKYFYGANLDLGTYADAWDFNVFFVEQIAEGLLDRRAVGGEVRFFEPKHSIVTLVDYDILYSELNTILVLANWTFENKTTINGMFDIRNSPIITTSNALIGQTVETLNELEESYSDSEIRELARDRTADSRSYMLGVSRPINEFYSVSGDVTVTKLLGTSASGGVEAIPDSSNDYFYSIQFSGSNLWREGDFTYLSTRYSDTASATTMSFLINSRIPLKKAWRVYPRMRVDFREYKRDKSAQETLLPSLRVNYRWKKRYHFEAEIGKEWVERELDVGDERSTSYFIDVGYRIDF